MHWLGYTALIGLPLFPALFLFATAAKWMQEYSSKILRCSVETTAQVIGAEKECVLNESGNNGSTRSSGSPCAARSFESAARSG